MNFELEIRTAVEAVRQASRLCREVRATLVTDETVAKKDKSPVTIADYGAQALVSLVLGAAYPEDPIVGEESADELRVNAAMRERVLACAHSQRAEVSEEQVLSAIDRCTHAGGPTGRFWTVDPIDGTKGFLRNEQYAVALALIEDGEVKLGVLGCPNLPVAADGSGDAGALFVAVRGQGATVQPLEGGSPVPVRVSARTEAGEAIVCESVESGHSSHSDSARIAEFLGIQQAPRRLDSQAKYAVVGRGEADIYLRLPTIAGYQEKIWDHAAGAILIEEAGGTVTDVRGNPLDFSQGRTLAANTGVVATNGPLHAEVLRVVQDVLAPKLI